MASFNPVKLAHYIAEPENGTENLSPIIFLHGLTGYKEMWGKIPQEVANKTKRKTFVVDQRNHGDTEWTEIFNFDILVDDLVHFMDSNSIKKAIIIGHSMGGIVGINTALKRPDRVEALIVEDMFVGKLPQPMMEMLSGSITFVQQFIKYIPKEFSEEQALQFFMEEMNKIIPEGMGSKSTQNNLSMFKGYFTRDKDSGWSFKCNLKAIEKALKDPDTLMSEPEGTFDGPACLIYGTLSFFVKKSDADNFKKHFPNSKCIPIEGASHNITGDCPEELTREILKFISES